MSELRIANYELRDQRGIFIIGAIITASAFMLIALVLAEFSLNHYVGTRRTLISHNALLTAEAGAEKALLEMNKNLDPPFSGSGGEVEFYNSNVKGRATYETTITTGALSNERVLIATGRIYLPTSSSSPRVTRKIRLTIAGTVPFQYGLQTGTGPIYLFGNTTFAADAHSNAFIDLQDNSVTIAGGNIAVAGTNPAYGDGTCSVTRQGKITGSTVNVAGQLTPSPPDCGVNTTGSTVQENQSISVLPLPTVDKDNIINGITATESPCSNIQNPVGGEYQIKNAAYPSTDPRSFDASCQANLKGNETYILKGNAYIRGELHLDRNTVIVDSGLTSPPYVLVEGKIIFEGNGSSVVPNSDGVGAIFVSYNDTDSNGAKTLPNAISIKGNSLSIFANFLAPNGSIGYEGRGSVGKLAGKSIIINGNGSTVFVDIAGSSTPPNIWSVKHYQQVFD